VLALALFLCLKTERKEKKHGNRLCREIQKIPTGGWKECKTIESYVGDIAGFVAYLQNMGVKF
jgi:hypothetical protein